MFLPQVNCGFAPFVHTGPFYASPAFPHSQFLNSVDIVDIPQFQLVILAKFVKSSFQDVRLVHSQHT